MKIRTRQLKRLVAEAVSQAEASDKLTDGFARALQPMIKQFAHELVEAMGNVASKFESDPDYGQWVHEFDFRENHELESDLVSELSKIVDAYADRAVEENMSSDEDRFSNGETYQTNAWEKTVNKRRAFSAARGRPARY